MEVSSCSWRGRGCKGKDKEASVVGPVPPKAIGSARRRNCIPTLDDEYPDCTVGFNIGGYELGLYPEGDASLTKSTNVVSYWGVEEDVQAVFDRLLDLGGTAHEAPTNVGGLLVVATVLDPWGNPIGLIYNPTFPNKL
jgi:hypothetical protein